VTPKNRIHTKQIHANLREVASLDHEVRDDAMERAALLKITITPSIVQANIRTGKVIRATIISARILSNYYI
jgi:hypothetical protein